MLDRMLGKSIAHVADGMFAIARERARIGHVAIARRLDKSNGRLLHIVLEMVAVRIEVDTTEVID